MKLITMRISLNTVTDALEKEKEKTREKDESMIAIVRELLKAFPNLDESEGMEYV